MTFSKLSLTCDATVERAWRDDSYPSYENDYLTLYIKIPGWTDHVFAKLYNKEGDPSPAANRRFNFTGEYFLNPGKEWTSTYFLIQKYTEITDEVLEPAIPTFRLSRAEVRQNLPTSVKVSWTVYDEYEMAGYGQVLSLVLDKSTENLIEGSSYEFQGFAERADKFRVTDFKTRL
jgi:hypothetical protein